MFSSHRWYKLSRYFLTVIPLDLTDATRPTNVAYESQRIREKPSALLGTYGSSHTVLVSDLVAEHEANSLFIPEGYLVSILDQVQSGVSDILES